MATGHITFYWYILFLDQDLPFGRCRLWQKALIVNNKLLHFNAQIGFAWNNNFECQAIEYQYWTMYSSLKNARFPQWKPMQYFIASFAWKLMKLEYLLLESSTHFNRLTKTAVTNTTVTNTAVTNTAVMNTTVTSTAVTSTAVTNTAVTSTAVTNAAVTNVAVTNSCNEHSCNEHSCNQYSCNERSCNELGCNEWGAKRADWSMRSLIRKEDTVVWTTE